MKRVAIFGNAGGGKSTLAKSLADITGFPLFVLDSLKFRDGRYRPDEKDGGQIPDEDFLQIHAKILSEDRWIIDGYGSLASAFERFAAADTLVFVDLPLAMHYRWITKRFLKGMVSDPVGWPANSPLWQSTVSGYKVAWLCHRRLTPKYRRLVAETTKRAHHLRSKAEIAVFLADVRREQHELP